MATSNTRYSTKGNIEDLYYGKTEILINKLGIKNKLLLEEVERQLLEKTVAFFFKKAKTLSSFDSRLLNKIHKHFFSRLYIWASNYRTVDISKKVTRFAVPKHIPGLMKKFDQEIQKDNYLIGLDKNKFLEKLAYYKCELIAIHPYREGNGRVIRLFCDLLALKNNYKPFEYSSNADFIKKYLKAAEIGVIKANYYPMLTILKKSFRS
jgi:cell filamentation protein